jgi:hypothetical protein
MPSFPTIITASSYMLAFDGRWSQSAGQLDSFPSIDITFNDTVHLDRNVFRWAISLKKSGVDRDSSFEKRGRYYWECHGDFGQDVKVVWNESSNLTCGRVPIVEIDSLE